MNDKFKYLSLDNIRVKDSSVLWKFLENIDSSKFISLSLCIESEDDSQIQDKIFYAYLRNMI